ncbi:MAG: hypothetical protein ACRDHO_06410 [Actinomycetota bacterium]
MSTPPVILSGTPLFVVSEVLGHASVSITKDVYGHLLGGEKQAATEAITAALFGPEAAAKDEDSGTSAG